MVGMYLAFVFWLFCTCNSTCVTNREKFLVYLIEIITRVFKTATIVLFQY